MDASQIQGRQMPEIMKKRFAVLPLGSFEYHGPHSPLGTDNILAEGFSNLIDNKLGGIVYPVIPYSACPGKTANYLGTISVRPSVMIEYLSDVLTGILSLGVSKVVLLNAHDGNMGIARSVAEYVTINYPDVKFLLINWWQMYGQDELGFIGTSGRGHGGPFEMSAVQGFREDLVNVQPEDCEYKEKVLYSEFPYITVEGKPDAWDGYTGLISQTSSQKGKLIISTVKKNMNKLIENWLTDLGG